MSRPAFVQALIDDVWSVADLPNIIGHWTPDPGLSASQWTDVGGAGRHFVQATPANQPVVTTLVGKAALQVGMVGGTRRLMTAPVSTGNVQALTDYEVFSASPSDTVDRVLSAYSASSEIRIKGYGTGNTNGGITVAVPDPPAARSEPALTYGGASLTTFVGGGATKEFFLDGYDMFTGGNPSSSNALGTFTLGNANTPTDGKACPSVRGYKLSCAATHSNALRRQVTADIVNYYDGVQVIWHGNSQGTYVHKTSTAEETARALKTTVTRLVLSTNYSVGGKQTPQMVSDFDLQVKPLINMLIKRRVYIGQEGENDLFTNGRNDSDALDTTYATTTAIANDKALFAKAAECCAGLTIMVGIPPTTAGTVGGGGGSDTPLNYEASRLARDAYWRANAKFVYRVWSDTWVENSSPALNPATGMPYVTIFVDAFNVLSPMGTIASLTESGYFESDRQHINVLGGVLFAVWMGRAVNYACSLMN